MDDLEGIDIATLFKMVKMNIERFLAKAKIVHGDTYDYSNVECDSRDSIVKIICMIHGEFNISVSSHLYKNRGCKQCSKAYRMNQEEFIEAATKKHNGKYDYPKMEKFQISKKVKIICPIHGDFKCIGSRHLHEGIGCKDCQYDSKRHTNEKFIAKANEVHGEGKYDYSLVDYKDDKVRVEIICPIHGIFEQIPNSHKRGAGCPDCGDDLLRMTQEEFVAKAKSIHGDAYDYSLVQYVNTRTEVKIICNVHKESFDMTPNHHISVKKSGCPRCSNNGYSSGQLEWLAFMESYYSIHIQHRGNSMKEYRIRDTKWLADGYCRNTNTIYEFHGDYWHGNPRVFDQESMHPHRHWKMGTLYNRTKKREARIKELGYKLVVMWEHDWKLICKTITQYQRRFRATRSE